MERVLKCSFVNRLVMRRLTAGRVGSLENSLTSSWRKRQIVTLARQWFATFREARLD